MALLYTIGSRNLWNSQRLAVHRCLHNSPLSLTATAGFGNGWKRLISRHSSCTIFRYTLPKTTSTNNVHSYRPTHTISYPVCLWHQWVRNLSFGGDQEISAVQQALEKITEGKNMNTKVKEKQLAFFKALTQDVSELTTELISKLNCETKLSAEEIYILAIAIFEARNYVSEEAYLTELAAYLFGYSGEQGDHNANYTYAQLLRTGQGVKMDLAKAAGILTDLAMKGHPYAQFALGGMYYNGSGVTQSFQRAYTLYKVSAQNYVPQAYNILGNMHRFGQGVKEDIKQAIEYYQKGCEIGDPLAHISMAHCYAHGKGVETSMEKSFENYLEASKSNNPLALYNVGTHYFSGQGVKQSYEKAAEYFEKASILGFSPAQVNLGNMYYLGMGVVKSKEKAKELFKLAADTDENAKGLLEQIESEEGAEKGDKKL